MTVGGAKVKLAAKRVGKCYLTSEAAVAAFLAALNPVIETEPADERTPAQRKRESEAAARKLAAGGW